MAATTIKGFKIDGSVKYIDYEEGIVNKPTIPTTVAELTDASSYATKEEVTSISASTRLDALESSAHTHANKNVLDNITSQNVSDWSAKQDALTDTDGGYGQRLKAVEDVLASAINFEAQKY